jgi:RNA polymerase sigma-70 factor (ECF subfamily)
MNATEDLEPRISSTQAAQVSAFVERARGGDRDAFEKLIVLHQDEIFRVVFFRTRSKIDSEDLVQDIFMSAFKYLPQLKDSDRFRPWLYRIALNRVNDFHRKNKFLALLGITEHREDTDVADVEPHVNPGALDTVIRKEFWSHVRQLSKRFSRMEREVFFLRFVEDLNLREIAQTLKRSESAVKTHLYRAIAKFKEDSAMSDFLQGERRDEKDQPS